MKTNIIPIVVLILITLFFRLYRLQSRYSFEWDQSDDAVKVMEIINLHKPRLIGPRVASDDSFFVGPYHYYFLLPFYLVTRGDPVAGAYAAVANGLIISLVTYFVGRLLFSPLVGFLAAFLFAISPSLVSWNAMYAPFYAITIFYLCYRLLSSPSPRILSLSLFLLSLGAATHLAPLSLAIPVLFSVFLSRRHFSHHHFLFAFLFSLLPLLPLVIFDFRHQFLNSTKLFAFITHRSPSAAYFPFLFLRSFWRSLNVFQLFPVNIERIVSLLLLFSGIFVFSSRRLRLLILVWILTPLILLSFYHGDIPEYYYGSVTALIPLFTAVFLSKIRFSFFFPILLIVLFFFKVKTTLFSSSHVSLASKKAVISAIVSDSSGQNFSVDYDLPPGWNSGYDYLFNRQPQFQSSAPLRYLIYHTAHPATGISIYSHDALGVARR